MLLIIGVGFGSPLTAIIMFLVTSILSYTIYKMITGKSQEHNSWEDIEAAKQRKRKYYYAQREKAREMIKKFDLTDEEIENKIKEEFGD